MALSYKIAITIDIFFGNNHFKLANIHIIPIKATFFLGQSPGHCYSKGTASASPGNVVSTMLSSCQVTWRWHGVAQKVAVNSMGGPVEFPHFRFQAMKSFKIPKIHIRSLQIIWIVVTGTWLLFVHVIIPIGLIFQRVGIPPTSQSWWFGTSNQLDDSYLFSLP